MTVPPPFYPEVLTMSGPNETCWHKLCAAFGDCLSTGPGVAFTPLGDTLEVFYERSKSVCMNLTLSESQADVLAAMVTAAYHAGRTMNEFHHTTKRS